MIIIIIMASWIDYMVNIHTFRRCKVISMILYQILSSLLCIISEKVSFFSHVSMPQKIVGFVATRNYWNYHCLNTKFKLYAKSGVKTAKEKVFASCNTRNLQCQCKYRHILNYIRWHTIENYETFLIAKLNISWTNTTS